MTGAPGLLVVNVSGIGDFVDSTPALRLLRRARPSEGITLLVSEKVLPLARPCPYADAAVGLPTAPGRGTPGAAGILRWLRRVLPLRGRFGTAVSLYPSASGRGGAGLRLLLRWIRAPRTVGWGAPEGGRPAPGTGGTDQVEAFLAAARLALSGGGDGSGGERRLELWVPASVREEARAWLAREFEGDDRGGPRIIVALGGDRRSRHETPERAAAWLGPLVRDLGIRPVLWGTARDPGLPEMRGTRVADARGRFGILHSVALISCADAVITTHSAPQHIASAFGIPTVVLAGPGNTARFRPHLPAGRFRILRHPVPCAPCDYMDCPLPGAEHQKCLAGVPPAAVAAALREVIAGTP